MTYLITGGTGSFGQAYAKWLIDNTDHVVRILSRDEQKQDEMRKRFNSDRLRFLLGDVRDSERLDLACRRVDVVVHAAALKIVPACEYTPSETIKTNVVGTMNVIDACVKNGVRRCVGIGTDKAVKPVNLYGASKLCAERLLIHSNSYATTVFNCVRYGNVIGSRGSVLGMFEKQETIEITHPEMTRFWMTLDRAVHLVNTAVLAPLEGVVIVPKAPSADMMTFKAAFAPGKPHRIIGLRAGEKIHETLIGEEESCRAVDVGENYIIHQTAFHDKPFEYRSDTNPWRIDAADLKALAA